MATKTIFIIFIDFSCRRRQQQQQQKHQFLLAAADLFKAPYLSKDVRASAPSLEN